MRSALALALALALLAPIASAEPVVKADTYRFDIGPLRPGEEREARVTLANAGDEPANVRLVADGTPPFYATASPDEFALAPGESREVQILYRVPQDASAGHHGEGLKIAMGVAGPNRFETGTAIVITSQVTAVGVVAIEAPETILPKGSLAGRVIVVNTLLAAASAVVEVRLVSSGGKVAAKADLPTGEIAGGGSTALAYAFGRVEAPRGRYEVQAVLKSPAPADAPLVGGAFAKPLAVGAREATLSVEDIRERADGATELAVAVENTGTVDVTVTPRARATPRDDALPPIDVEGEPVSLQPGEKRQVTLSLPLPVGSYDIALTLKGADGLSIVAEPVETTYSVAPRLEGADWGLALLASPGLLRAAVLALALASVVAGAWLLTRSRAARPRARRAIAPALAPPPEVVLREPEPVSVAAAEPPSAPLPVETRERAAAATEILVLIDFDSFLGKRGGLPVDPRALVSGALAGRSAWRAVGYATAATEARAGVLHAKLRAAGIEPKVFVANSTEAATVALAVDALAIPAAAVAIGSHNAALANLAAALRARGTRTEAFGFEGRVPASLLAHADAFHLVRAPKARKETLEPASVAPAAMAGRQRRPVVFVHPPNRKS